MSKKFYDQCEEIFQNWIGKKEYYKEFSNDFLMEYLPEPYVTNSKGKNRIFILVNNPGGGMEHQNRDNILKNKSFINGKLSYKEISEQLGKYYMSEEFRIALGRNSAAMLRGTKSIAFANNLGYQGIQFVETVPFHSSKFNKGILKKLLSSNFYQEYRANLKSLLEYEPVVMISGISGREDISKNSINKSKWLKHQAELMNFSVEKCQVIPVRKSEEKKLISVAVAVEKNKIMILSMGNNNFPNIDDEVLEKIKKLL